MIGLVLKNPNLEERLLLLVAGLNPFRGVLEEELGLLWDVSTSLTISGTELLRLKTMAAAAVKEQKKMSYNICTLCRVSRNTRA